MKSNQNASSNLLISMCLLTLSSISLRIIFRFSSEFASARITSTGSVFDFLAKYQPTYSPSTWNFTLTPSTVDDSKSLNSLAIESTTANFYSSTHGTLHSPVVGRFGASLLSSSDIEISEFTAFFLDHNSTSLAAL